MRIGNHISGSTHMPHRFLRPPVLYCMPHGFLRPPVLYCIPHGFLRLQQLYYIPHGFLRPPALCMISSSHFITHRFFLKIIDSPALSDIVIFRTINPLTFSNKTTNPAP